MLRRAGFSVLVAVGLLLAWAAPVLASSGGDDGEGWVGEANDQIITFASLGVVLFFPVVVTLLSLLQSALERRKERREAASRRRPAGW
jgi:hypothetical protein